MNKTRIQWIDFARVLAILTVVFCHCLDNIYHIIDPNVVTTLSISSKIFVFGGYAIGRLGVPFFLMITGYLLLDRVYDSEKITGFWSRNCKHLLICTIIWCVYANDYWNVYPNPIRIYSIEEFRQWNYI